MYSINRIELDKTQGRVLWPLNCIIIMRKKWKSNRAMRIWEGLFHYSSPQICMLEGNIVFMFVSWFFLLWISNFNFESNKLYFQKERLAIGWKILREQSFSCIKLLLFLSARKFILHQKVQKSVILKSKYFSFELILFVVKIFS